MCVCVCVLKTNKEKQNFKLDFYTNDCPQSLTFQKINRIITAVDSQPMFDGGVLINVLGRLQVNIIEILIFHVIESSLWPRAVRRRSTTRLLPSVCPQAVGQLVLLPTRHVPPQHPRHGLDPRPAQRAPLASTPHNYSHGSLDVRPTTRVKRRERET